MSSNHALLSWPVRLCLAFAMITALFFAVPPAHASAELQAQVYDRSLPLQQRIEAMQQLTGLNPATARTYRICIWDIFGRSGPIFAAAQDQRRRILQFGVNVEMVPYTSETVMVEELKSGTCDAALMSGLRARLFNRYTGSIDSIGGLTEIEQMRMALTLMADPRSADRMVSGDYVVLGIAPGGAAYVFVNDREINTLAKASGKRVVVLDYDPTQARMIAGVGATPVVADIVNAPNMFNTGVVDVLAAPLAAYEVLELHRGLGDRGGIIEIPLAQITMQLIGRADAFPNELGQFIREAFLEGFGEIIERLQAEEVNVPGRWWISIPDDDRQEYERMMQEARVQLRDEGYYDGDMLSLLRRIRCRTDASRPECTDPVE
ncbi:MAG: DUF6091 family protein [Marinobacter sp.]|nr:DUF6091 family protein [Marinobacter sp.]